MLSSVRGRRPFNIGGAPAAVSVHRNNSDGRKVNLEGEEKEEARRPVLLTSVRERLLTVLGLRSRKEGIDI